MDKPVIVSEETLVAPVVAPGITDKAAATGPAYLVLGGISFSHFLNDTMQSLIPSVYPILKENYALDFAQIGMITLAFQVTASLLQPVVGYVTDKKAQPFSLAIGMGFTFVGLAAAERRSCLRDDPCFRRTGRPWLRGVPSGVRAHRANGVGWSLWLRAIGFSGRREFRLGDGAGAGGADHRAVRAAQHCVVFVDRICRDRRPVCKSAGGTSCGSRRARVPNARRSSETPAPARTARRTGDSDRAGVLEIHLHVQPDELLHLLSDREVSRLDADTRSFCCSCFSARSP